MPRGRSGRAAKPRLPRAERRRLLRAASKERDAGTRLRYLAVAGWAQGKACHPVAQSLGVSPPTVSRAVRRYREHGEAGLVDRRCENGFAVSGCGSGATTETSKPTPMGSPQQATAKIATSAKAIHPPEMTVMSVAAERTGVTTNGTVAMLRPMSNERIDVPDVASSHNDGESAPSRLFDAPIPKISAVGAT